MKKSQKVAIIIMALMILISVPLGMSKSLSSLRKDALEYYIEDSQGFSISQGIENRIEKAEEILTIAKNYTEKENMELLDNMGDVDVSLSDLSSSDSHSIQQSEANRDLDSAVKKLADYLMKLELKKEQKETLTTLIADFNLQQKLINHSSYNEEAAEFNETLESFPASIIRAAGIVRPLPEY